MRQTCSSDAEERWRHGRVDESWKDAAACLGTAPYLWFPVDDGRRHYDPEAKEIIKTARMICNECPVRTQCLQYAIVTDARYGIYGGLTERERARITGRRPY